MTRLRSSMVALVLALTACADDVPRRAERAVAAPQRFAAGDVLRYRFEWKVESSAITGVLPDAMPMDAGMHLAGELALRVLPRSGEQALLGITIVGLDRHSITVMDQEALPGAADLVGHEIFATVADDGEVLALHYEHDTPPLAMHVLPGLLAQIDLRQPTEDAGATQARVPTGSGLADVDYAWTNPGTIARTLRGYARLDAFEGATADADGRLEVTLDERGLPLRIDGAEEVWTPVAAGADEPFRSHSTFAMARVSITRDTGATMPELDALLHRDPAAAPDDAEAERALAQRFAAGLDDTGVALAVHAAGAGLSPSPELLVRAIGRLRGWPELAAEVGELFAAHEHPRARSLVADMLASAGTPEAQAVLCELLGEPSAQAQPQHAAWIQRFAFVTRPTPGTARFLLDEHERARGLAEPHALHAVAYPMGSVARRIATTDPVAAAALRSRLRETLEEATAPMVVVAALAGLGNAGTPADLPLLLAHADDERPEIRVAVANALERQHDARATAALLRLLHDRDPFVADAALTSLDGRGHDGDAQRLAGVALGGAFVPELDGRLTSALARRRSDGPVVEAALLAMRVRTAEPSERDRIDATLAATRAR